MTGGRHIIESMVRLAKSPEGKTKMGPFWDQVCGLLKKQPVMSVMVMVEASIRWSGCGMDEQAAAVCDLVMHTLVPLLVAIDPLNLTHDLLHQACLSSPILAKSYTLHLINQLPNQEAVSRLACLLAPKTDRWTSWDSNEAQGHEVVVPGAPLHQLCREALAQGGKWQLYRQLWAEMKGIYPLNSLGPCHG